MKKFFLLTCFFSLFISVYGQRDSANLVGFGNNSPGIDK